MLMSLASVPVKFRSVEQLNGDPRLLGDLLRAAALCTDKIEVVYGFTEPYMKWVDKDAVFAVFEWAPLGKLSDETKARILQGVHAFVHAGRIQLTDASQQALELLATDLAVKTGQAQLMNLDWNKTTPTPRFYLLSPDAVEAEVAARRLRAEQLYGKATNNAAPQKYTGGRSPPDDARYSEFVAAFLAFQRLLERQPRVGTPLTAVSVTWMA